MLQIIIYLQSECIENYQFKLCSKCDREYGFDVIAGQVVFCRKLRRICRKHSNDVARQVETPRGQFLPRDKFILSHDITFMSHRWLRYTMTAKQINAAIDAFLV